MLTPTSPLANDSIEQKTIQLCYCKVTAISLYMSTFKHRTLKLGVCILYLSHFYKPKQGRSLMKSCSCLLASCSYAQPLVKTWKAYQWCRFLMFFLKNNNNNNIFHFFLFSSCYLLFPKPQFPIWIKQQKPEKNYSSSLTISIKTGNTISWMTLPMAAKIEIWKIKSNFT